MLQIRKLTMVFAALVNIVLSGCLHAQQGEHAGNGSSGVDSLSAKRILIVYLTRTGNTEAIAKIIQQEIGGDLVSLELVNPYPKDYKAQVAAVVRDNENGFLPPLKTKIDSMENYDIVFVGFPTWDMKMPPPMKSFLTQYNLRCKIFIPFNTNAGYGVGSGFSTVKELSPGCKVLEGFSIKGGIERDGVLFVMEGDKEKQARSDVNEWLKKIGLISAR